MDQFTAAEVLFASLFVICLFWVVYFMKWMEFYRFKYECERRDRRKAQGDVKTLLKIATPPWKEANYDKWDSIESDDDYEGYEDSVNPWRGEGIE